MNKTIFKGNGLTEGAKPEDYSAVIGADTCDVSELLSNRLSCRPPKSEPKVRKTGNYKNGKPRLVVSICVALNRHY